MWVAVEIEAVDGQKRIEKYHSHHFLRRAPEHLFAMRGTREEKIFQLIALSLSYDQKIKSVAHVRLENWREAQ